MCCKTHWRQQLLEISMDKKNHVECFFQRVKNRKQFTAILNMKTNHCSSKRQFCCIGVGYIIGTYVYIQVIIHWNGGNVVFEIHRCITRKRCHKCSGVEIIFWVVVMYVCMCINIYYVLCKTRLISRHCKDGRKGVGVPGVVFSIFIRLKRFSLGSSRDCIIEIFYFYAQKLSENIFFPRWKPTISFLSHRNVDFSEFSLFTLYVVGSSQITYSITPEKNTDSNNNCNQNNDNNNE